MFGNYRDISKIRILVPGAGLGRLTYELAYRGYYCEGNEFSLFMLVASNFVLNKCIVENQYTIVSTAEFFIDFYKQINIGREKKAERKIIRKKMRKNPEKSIKNTEKYWKIERKLKNQEKNLKNQEKVRNSR